MELSQGSALLLAFRKEQGEPGLGRAVEIAFASKEPWSQLSLELGRKRIYSCGNLELVKASLETDELVVI